MGIRTKQGSGRPDVKMSRNDSSEKRSRFGTGTPAHHLRKAQANAKRRQRDRTACIAFEAP